MAGSSAPAIARDIRPGLAFRIGVVGHRQIADENAVASAARAVVAAVSDALAATGGKRDVADAYRNSERPGGTIHILSGLAEGADQICAAAALLEDGVHKSKVEHTAVLPCSAERFVAGFSGSQTDRWRAGFDKLLHASRGSFVLDGIPSRSDFSLAYEAVARIVVLNSDLVIAVWNGKDGGGWGGTQASLQLAFDHNVPVVWVRTGDTAGDRDADISLVCSRSDLALAFDRLPSRESCLADIRQIVRKVVDFPTEATHEVSDHSPSALPPITAWIEKAATKLVQKGGPDAVPTTFLRGGDRTHGKQLPIPDIHALLRRVFASKYIGLSEPRASQKNGAAVSLFDRAFQAADDDAIAHAKRDRAAIATSIAFGTFAALIAVAGLALPSLRDSMTFVADSYGPIKSLLLAVEFATLAYILAVVYSVRTRALTEAWVGTRLLAELLRTAPYLHRVGRSLRLTSDMGGAHAAGALAPWAIWYHNAIIRDAGLASVDFASPEAKRATLATFADEIVSRQLDYNRRTHSANHAIALGLEWLGEILFVATLALLVLKAAMIALHVSDAILATTTALTIAWPILSAGLLALRELGGFLQVERRSAYMAKELSVAADACRLLGARIESGEPLVSLELGALEERIAWQLVGDAANWVALFETKNPVAG